MLQYLRILNKKVLLVSMVIAIVVSVLMRAHLIAFTPDFKYYRFGPIKRDIQQIEFSFYYIGTKVIGMGGFPFSTYNKCEFQPSGTLQFPFCDKYSILGEAAVLANIIFWTAVFYLGIIGVLKIGSKSRAKFLHS